MIDYADIVCGLEWGDEAKGKVVAELADNYDMVCRWGGGQNAGHTVYIDGKKHKTHIVPCGIFKSRPSIIGPNCILNIYKFNDEFDYLKSNGFDINLIKIDPRVNMVTQSHIDYDIKYLKEKLGTTGQGIARCYADKMLRIGQTAANYFSPHMLWDKKLNGRILCEGAQGARLDPTFGNYPYVTSCETLPYAACSLGFPPQKIRNIYGVAKIYTTKSGVDLLFPSNLLDDPILSKLGELGNERGVTTGRRRICNWMRLDMLLEAINITGTTHVIINKCDIIEKLGIFKLFECGNNLVNFESLQNMKNFIRVYIEDKCPLVQTVKFSHSAEKI